MSEILGLSSAFSSGIFTRVLTGVNNNLLQIITEYKADTQSVYNTWFIDNDQRLKAFRTIRRGVLQVVEDIKNKTFPNDFKSSSLEFVLNSIAEQKQVFVGVSHPFYWKPKLRIPDIYENQNNKIAFGQFLENCINAKSEEQIIKEIVRLDALKIKGLGPAVGSILYFLHPTLFPPFNTAIINGFNALFNDKKKLGSWIEYLKIREILIETNNKYKSQLSNDLGAIAGLCFEIGTQKMIIVNDGYLGVLGANKMSGFVAHHLSGFHTVPRRYRNETGRMVTGDSEDEIRRSVWKLAERSLDARRSGAFAGCL